MESRGRGERCSDSPANAAKPLTPRGDTAAAVEPNAVPMVRSFFQAIHK